jgi:hypothetical protein
MNEPQQLSKRPERSVENVINLKDKNLFGETDATFETSLENLNAFFLDDAKFDSFRDINNPLYIVSARKGMGKSALLSVFEYELGKNDNLVIIKTTGVKLFSMKENENLVDKNHFYLENFWRKCISKYITIEIAKQIKFPHSDIAMKLVESAEDEDFKDKNIIASTLSRIKFGINLTGAELKPERDKTSDWESALDRYQKKYSDSSVWLLVDDIDSKYDDSDSSRDLISCFFSAIAGLTKDIQNLHTRATVRTDVWQKLRHYEDLDKLRPYITQIDWKENDLKIILTKRIITYIKRVHPNTKEAKYDLKKDSDKILSLLFVPDNKTLFGSKEIKLQVAVTKYAGQVPRAMIELCKMASEKACNKGFPKIGRTVFDKVKEEFGQNRVSDLIKEHKYQFKDLNELIISFRSGKRYYLYSELIEFLNEKYLHHRGQENVPNISTYSYKSPDQLGEILYQIGFFNGMPVKDDDQVESNSSSNNWRFQENPDLFATIDNKEDKIWWSIHPTYRNFLAIR